MSVVGAGTVEPPGLTVSPSLQLDTVCLFISVILEIIFLF